MKQRPLTRRQRQMLRDAAEHPNSRHAQLWARGISPCPRIGDLKVLAGLVRRGLMVCLRDDGEHDKVPEIWPRFIAITEQGLAAAAELALRSVKS